MASALESHNFELCSRVNVSNANKVKQCMYDQRVLKHYIVLKNSMDYCLQHQPLYINPHVLREGV